MTSREVFVVGARIVGLLELGKALDFLIEAFDISSGLYKPYAITMAGCYVHILVYLGVGLYLLSGAPHIVPLVFDRSIEKREEKSTTREEDAKV
jgi:hypothetical protein